LLEHPRHVLPVRQILLQSICLTIGFSHKTYKKQQSFRKQPYLYTKQFSKGIIFVSLILSLYNKKEKCLNNGKDGKVTKKRRCDNHD